MKNNWSIESENKIIDMKLSGLKNSEIAQEFNTNEKAIKTLCTRLRSENKLQRTPVLQFNSPSKYDSWTDEELYDLIREFKRPTLLIDLRDDFLPYPAYIVKRFNKSWDSLRRELGVEIDNDLRSSKSITTLYLVHFLEEDFYKIGLTRSSINKRLRIYPRYNIVDSRQYDSWEEAKKIESNILNKVAAYKYEPLLFPKIGCTECFSFNKNNLTSISDLE